MRALLNYTTDVSAEKSISEIQRMLAMAGASAVLSEYNQLGQIVALSFRMKLGGQDISFRLPTDPRPVLELLGQQKEQYRRAGKRFRATVDEDQALRVAWRITKDWVEAQLAIIETRMVTTAQVFLPYAVTAAGQSLYEYVGQHTGLLLGSGEDGDATA